MARDPRHRDRKSTWNWLGVDGKWQNVHVGLTCELTGSSMPGLHKIFFVLYPKKF